MDARASVMSPSHLYVTHTSCGRGRVEGSCSELCRRCNNAYVRKGALDAFRLDPSPSGAGLGLEREGMLTAGQEVDAISGFPKEMCELKQMALTRRPPSGTSSATGIPT